MKNTISLILLLFFASIAGCNKDSSNTTSATYRVEGLADIQIGFAAGSSSSMVLTFNPNGSISEAVSFTFSGLPAGISVDTTHVSQGMPVFSSVITFSNDGTATPGTYSVSLNCIGSLTKIQKNYKFNLIVLPISSGNNCNVALQGHWNYCINLAHEFGVIDTTIFSDNIISGDSNSVVFLNGNGFNTPIYAIADCKTGTLTFPKTKNYTEKTWGNGTFTSNYIKYTFYDSDYISRRYEVTMTR